MLKQCPLKMHIDKFTPVRILAGVNSIVITKKKMVLF